jgi:transcriptional regulator with XRE-family HTH domain
MSKELSRRIEDLCIATGWSQAELARRMHCSRSLMSNVIKGRSQLSHINVLKLEKLENENLNSATEMKMTKAMTKLMRANRLMRDAVRELAAVKAGRRTFSKKVERKLCELEDGKKKIVIKRVMVPQWRGIHQAADVLGVSVTQVWRHITGEVPSRKLEKRIKAAGIEIEK